MPGAALDRLKGRRSITLREAAAAFMAPPPDQEGEILAAEARLELGRDVLCAKRRHRSRPS